MRKLFLTAFLLLIPAGISAQTADEVLQKYINARGGLEKIRAIQTERISGTISFGPGEEGPFLVERARPLKMHMEIAMAGQTLIRVFDGKSTGWIYNPFAPNPSVQPMGPGELAGMVEEADFEGPFIDVKEKGNQVEFAAKDTVDGKAANKLKVITKKGETNYFYFDAEGGLLLKWEGVRKTGEQEVLWQSYFRDYRDVQGVKYPFVVESNAPGTDQTQKIVAEKIEVNLPIAETEFQKPNPPPAAPPAGGAESAKPN